MEQWIAEQAKKNYDTSLIFQGRAEAYIEMLEYIRAEKEKKEEKKE